MEKSKFLSRAYNGNDESMNFASRFFLDIGGIPLISTVVVCVLLILISSPFIWSGLYLRRPFNLFQQKLFVRPLKFWFLKLFQEYFLFLTWGELFVLIVWVLLNFVWFFFHNLENWKPVDLSAYYSYSNGFGRVALFNFLFVLFPAHRFSVLKLLFGIGFEHSLKFHKLLGVVIFFSVFVHFVMVLFDCIWQHQVGYLFLWNVERFLNQPLPGVIAGVCMLVLFLFTFERIRRYFYDGFWWVHMVFACLSFVFVLFHRNYSTIGMMFLPLALTFVDFLYRIFIGYLLPCKVKRFEYFPKSRVLKLVLWKTGYSFLRSFFRPASVVFLWSSHRWFSLPHPFTVCSSTKDNEVVLYIMSVGKWTKKLHELAGKNPEKLRKKTIVRLDGPYGAYMPYERFERFFLSSDGLMFAPLLGIITDVMKRKLRNVELKVLWSIRKFDYFEVFGEELKFIFEHLHEFPNIQFKIFMTGQQETKFIPSSSSVIEIEKEKKVNEQTSLLVNENIQKEEERVNDNYEEVLAQHIIYGQSAIDFAEEFDGTSKKERKKRTGMFSYAPPYFIKQIHSGMAKSKATITFYETVMSF